MIRDASDAPDHFAGMLPATQWQKAIFATHHTHRNIVK